MRRALFDLEHRNSDLVAVRDELEEAMGAKDQFLARMSHELRTPLTTIIGFTRRLENTLLTREQAEYSHAVHHASVILLSVINDLLDFSRMQYGGISLERTAFNLEDEMEDIASMHAYGAYEKSIELVLFIDSSVPRDCLGDPLRLKQIVNNLLANAVKFTESGEILVHISEQDPEPADTAGEGRGEGGTHTTLVITVRDSGIGIDAQDMKNLFEPFSQADTSISRRFGGSGLGLVICRQLVELMGGEIQLSSNPGAGTEVVCTVQLEACAGSAAELAVPERGECVAVIDGNKWSRRALRSQLTHWTRQVYAVAQPGDFIRLLRERSPGGRHPAGQLWTR